MGSLDGEVDRGDAADDDPTAMDATVPATAAVRVGEDGVGRGATTNAISASASSGSAQPVVAAAGSSSSGAARGCNRARVKRFLLQQHLPLGLLTMVVFGFLVPEPGIAVGRTPMSTASICAIFFISGLNLATSEIKSALRAYVAIAFGLVSILAITPLLSLVIVYLPLQPPAYAQGLALFACMPTTISSGALMTGEARGNVALALLLSVVTNLVGVVSVPFFLQAILADSADSVEIDPLDLLWKLALTILLPLGIGKALRRFPAVVVFAGRHKMHLKLTSSAFLICVPWITMSQSAARLRQTTVASMFVLLACGIALHLLLLGFNIAACRVLPLKAPERKAIILNCSQKTTNTAISVIQFLPPTVGDRGLLMLPCIVSHFAQTIMDAFIATYWHKKAEAEDAAAAAAAAAAATAAPTDDAVAAATAPDKPTGVASSDAVLLAVAAPDADLTPLSPPPTTGATPLVTSTTSTATS